MASEKQIRANRANARKSTGPRTAEGRLKSSRNAFRHGLSLPLELDPAMLEKAKLLMQNWATEGQQLAMAEIVHAQLDLLRIRTVRNQLMQKLDLLAGEQASSDLTSAEALWRLLAVDRYEAQASRKRRRALHGLSRNEETQV